MDDMSIFHIDGYDSISQCSNKGGLAIWVILLKPGHYCDIEVENLKFDIFFFFIADEI